MDDRKAHWIPHNLQERIPPRMVAFDTESWSRNEDDLSIQSFRTASAIMWRTDLKSGDNCQASSFTNPVDLWSWISGFCRKGTRTVVWAHNLGYDVRISQVFTILPTLGFKLEWCNLDRNVSAMTWRSDHGTLVLCDTWTWIPLPLNVIAPMTGLVKFAMPKVSADDETWNGYCQRDTEIVYRVVSSLVRFIRKEHLGNWQPTGAGMAFTTWRHRFMSHKVLVHDDMSAISAEREAMHTGRAEAWRHGTVTDGPFHEIDMRNAYLRIAAQYDMPRKLHSSTGAVSVRQFQRLRDTYAVLCLADINTDVPSVPCKTEGRHLWPTGTFATWLWDTEIDLALRYGATVKIRKTYLYVKAPILRDWANWVYDKLYTNDTADDAIAATWIKHCSRALIGRMSMRAPSWEVFGSNPEGITGMTHMVDVSTGAASRMMHVGDRTLIETGLKEGRHSLPQVTGYIMAVCRTLLFDAMNAVGWGNVAHVDTDSILCTTAGMNNLRVYYGDEYVRYWHEKGLYRTLTVYGPRCYFRDKQRVTSGIPLRATLGADGKFHGERWTSTSGDLEHREGTVVTTYQGTWVLTMGDPRRADAPGVAGGTVPYQVAASPSSRNEKSAASSTGS
jgi:DNA polymerase type B, organellar and viral